MRKKLYASRLGEVAHPAVFSNRVLARIPELLSPDIKRVLDPFAGIGKIHELPKMVGWRMETVGIELEPEWALVHPDTAVGNALALPFGDDSFDAVITSPVFSNRLSDSHNAKDPSFRRSYTHDLGRTLSPESSGAMQWGAEYRNFHVKAWLEAQRVVRRQFVLNISDHIRNKERVFVSSWHIETLIGIGFKFDRIINIDTARMKYGENRERVDAELLVSFFV